MAKNPVNQAKAKAKDAHPEYQCLLGGLAVGMHTVRPVKPQFGHNNATTTPQQRHNNATTTPNGRRTDANQRG